MSRFTFQDVWDLVRMIPEGRVATYGMIARMLGLAHGARLVGFALHAAPESVPCHRVVSSTGGLSDAFEPFGRKTHRFLLEMEQVPFTSSDHVDLNACLWHPEFLQEENLWETHAQNQ